MRQYQLKQQSNDINPYLTKHFTVAPWFHGFKLNKYQIPTCNASGHFTSLIRVTDYKSWKFSYLVGLVHSENIALKSAGKSADILYLPFFFYTEKTTTKVRYCSCTAISYCTIVLAAVWLAQSVCIESWTIPRDMENKAWGCPCPCLCFRQKRGTKV